MAPTVYPQAVSRDTEDARLGTFLDELERWNGRVNLTAVSRDQAWARHVEESDLLLASLDGVAMDRIVDVGSGCGVPGVVVAVRRPRSAVTLVESDRRKAGFLIHIAGLLAVDNVAVVAERAEVMVRRPEWRGQADLLISRAMAPPQQLCELTLAHLRPGGVLAALVGDDVVLDDSLRTAITAAGGENMLLHKGILRVTRARD